MSRRYDHDLILTLEEERAGPVPRPRPPPRPP